jgi:hypothetical protein
MTETSNWPGGAKPDLTKPAQAARVQPPVERVFKRVALWVLVLGLLGTIGFIAVQSVGLSDYDRGWMIVLGPIMFGIGAACTCVVAGLLWLAGWIAGRPSR